MKLACRMMDRNNHNYSISKLPALNMSNFFFTSPSSSCDGCEKDFYGNNVQNDVNNNKPVVRPNDFMMTTTAHDKRLARQNELKEKKSRQNENSNEKKSNQISLDQSNMRTPNTGEPDNIDHCQIPDIQILTNSNLLDLPTVEENRIPVLESFPACVCLDTSASTDNLDGIRKTGKSTSLDENAMHRAQSEQYLFEHCINHDNTKLVHKTRKKFIPIFRYVSRSIDGLDTIENEHSTNNKTNKSSPPSLKRRFHRVTSEPFIEPPHLRNDLGHTRSLMNIRSPFVSRKSLQKVIDPEDGKRKMHSEMLNCIRTDDCKGFRSLLKKKLVDVNVVTKDGALIHDASYKGCTKCLKSLLKGGCYVNLCDDLGWTALHAAVLSNSLDAIKLLLENYALPNQLNTDGLSPCHLAVITGDLYIVHELIKAGGDPLVKNSTVTPFQLAIDLKQTTILDYFLHMPTFLVDA